MALENERSPAERGDKQLDDIMRHIGYFIRRDYDILRARKYWAHILETAPKEVIAEALSIELGCGRYQEKPCCNCCGR